MLSGRKGSVGKVAPEVSDGHIPATYLDYLAMLEDVFAECVAKLIDVARTGRTFDS